MSGGAWEYMAAYRSGGIGSSGFSTLPTGKYVDIYTDLYNSDSNYTGRILGDATGELGPFASNAIGSWYSDYVQFVDSALPWFVRSGYYGNVLNAGAFFFISIQGDTYKRGSFRLVLAP